MNYNYIDVNELVISSQDVDNTYIALNENGELVRTKIATGGGGEGGDVDLSNYYTKTEVDRKIENIEIPEPDLSDYYTKQEINNKGFVTDSDVNDYVGNEIGQLEEVINTKQDKLISGTNIKTVNGVSLLGNGDVPIEIPEPDLSDYYTKDEIEDIIDEIDLTPFVTEEELDLKEYVTETELQTRLENLDLSSYYTKTEIDRLIGDINNILETI